MLVMMQKKHLAWFHKNDDVFAVEYHHGEETGVPGGKKLRPVASISVINKKDIHVYIYMYRYVIYPILYMKNF
jgi:hypothetical protein